MGEYIPRTWCRSAAGRRVQWQHLTARLACRAQRCLAAQGNAGVVGQGQEYARPEAAGGSLSQGLVPSLDGWEAAATGALESDPCPIWWALCTLFVSEARGVGGRDGGDLIVEDSPPHVGACGVEVGEGSGVPPLGHGVGQVTCWVVAVGSAPVRHPDGHELD